TQRGDFAGEHRLLERQADEADGAEVVHLRRLACLQRGDERGLVEQVAFHELDARTQVGDGGEPRVVLAANQSAYRVALLQQQLREIRAVLPGDAGDEC